MALHVLSGQEARIEKEIETGAPVYVSNNRATRLLERVRTQKPVIDIERGLYFTESFRETEGQPLNLRWAKALYHYAENATVYLEEDQLLSGRAGKLGRYGVLYPELDGDILDEAIARLPERETSPFDIDPADAKIVAEVISPFWKGKTFHEDLGTAFPPDTRKLTYNADGTSRFIVNETASYRSSIQWVHDYEIVLKKGISGIKAEAVERLGALDPDSAVDTMEKKPFLEATILTCDAIVLWAHRHAVLAREKAERDPANRDFYLKIAEASDWVPENPPRSFYEAVIGDVDGAGFFDEERLKIVALRNQTFFVMPFGIHPLFFSFREMDGQLFYGLSRVKKAVQIRAVNVRRVIVHGFDTPCFSCTVFFLYTFRPCRVHFVALHLRTLQKAFFDRHFPSAQDLFFRKKGHEPASGCTKGKTGS